jgi:phage-related protein
MDINYRIKYYKNSHNNQEPVKEFIDGQVLKIQQKIFIYLELLQENGGRLNYPYSSHIKDKIWELRIDFAKNCYRIFYFVFIDKRIILLHAFLKKTNKTPRQEIQKAINSYNDFISNN